MAEKARSIAILAGGGSLPGALADALRGRGIEVRILAFRGFADSVILRRAEVINELLDIKKTLEWLNSWQPSCVMLAGSVSRPQPSAVLSALSAYRNRHELAALMAVGDDGLLGGVIRFLEENGHRVEGIDTRAPELLGRLGLRTDRQLNEDDSIAINIGVDLLRAISRFDVGQAAVIGGKRVIAIEGPEGTDTMLRRVWMMRLTHRWKAENQGILVKTAKEGQDFRMDLPVIGPRTVIWAARAGLKGIAYGAGRTLIINEEKTLREAKRRGLFVVGIAPDATVGAFHGE